MRWDPPRSTSIHMAGCKLTEMGRLEGWMVLLVVEGGVIRDEHRRWLGGFAKNMGDCSTYIAELWGALEGLRLAKVKSYKQVDRATFGL